jgi:hypothetical protein
VFFKSFQVGDDVRDKNIKGVGRIRGRMLFRAGCKTIEDVQDADPGRLSRATGLSEQTCTRIINSAREYQPVDDSDGGDQDIIDNATT